MTRDAGSSRDRLVSVILCGGSGTRLWPLSRESYPKQFLALTGGRSMLQDTVLRLRGLAPSIALDPSPIVVCNAAHRFVTGEQLAEVDVPQSRIVLEPVGRNTAPALTLAALQAQVDAERDGSRPVLLAMPADHVVADQEAFQQAVAKGFEAACGGAMVTFGIVADRAETGYGYIERGEAAGDGIFAIASFAEKPDADTAGRYLATGRHLWNSGLFLVGAEEWLQAIAALQPDILKACRAAMKDATRDCDFIRPEPAAFAACPSDSIDYAVMERLPATPALQVPALVVPMQVGWSDLGAWDALWQVLPHDAHGNATVGEAMLHDSRGCLIFSSTRLVAGAGLDDIVVVETPDAVLVIDKRRTQDVKKLVARLKAGRHVLADSHRKTYRPWGWYDSIDSGSRFQVKRIVVKPGATLSLQMHHHRAEHWIVVKGTAQVTNGEKVFLLGENESTFIPLGHVHSLANPGKVPLEIIEVQSGSYLEEDDIVRFKDTYGRVLAPAGSQGRG